MNVHSVEEVRKMSVVAPATGKVIAEIEETPVYEVPFFYQKARESFGNWSGLAISERIRYLKNLKQLMVDEMDQIAKIISDDTGKVLTESIVADIMPTLDAIDHIIRHAEKVLSRKKVKTPLLLIGKKSFIEYMPRGVVLVISPWNYPLQLAMVPMISALAGGNSVILKPSEVTPLVGKCIEDLFRRSGFPEGTVQVAHGGKEVGAAFTAGKPDYIFFTGSVRTGKIIQQQAAKDLIPTTLELGGKDPMIVFDDANLDRAVKAAAWGAFTNSGQVCMSAERLYVQKSIYGKFLEKLKKEVNSLQQGTDLDSDIGSMTFPGQKEVVKAQLDEAIERGAKLETGLKPSDWKGDMFLPLTVITEVKQDMKIIQEESFGPLLPVVPFDTEEEAIEYANGTVFGLNASVWTRDKAKARRVASRLVSGAVVINDVIITVANHGLPFGGTKESGIGRYHSEAGLRIFCHEKAIMEDMGFMKSEIQWYPYKGKYPLFLKLFQSYFAEKRDWLNFAKNYIALLKRNK
ncbi:aldehyde dehydrogenase family protein [Mesobacillus subterraneus]|uniref:aldehyde dehydrogenase family protein n=1 Tax=Mesobacillus subterraneus TaxID=285983 RepID=UPI00203C3F80|nr:aldehyde dehydrogenase family protein [Mesobacillus subterraneus]MCM3573034.1 aldehyde dehydrogenase family protein [Mesobacillus subterraneus]